MRTFHQSIASSLKFFLSYADTHCTHWNMFDHSGRNHMNNHVVWRNHNTFICSICIFVGEKKVFFPIQFGGIVPRCAPAPSVSLTLSSVFLLQIWRMESVSHYIQWLKFWLVQCVNLAFKKTCSRSCIESPGARLFKTGTPFAPSFRFRDTECNYKWS